MHKDHQANQAELVAEIGFENEKKLSYHDETNSEEKQRKSSNKLPSFWYPVEYPY